MSSFTIGESVELNGLLAELKGGRGRVVTVIPNEHGIKELDEYEIVFDDSRLLRFCRFQLTHMGAVQCRELEAAACD
jgi:hypothetical protein